MNLTDINQVRAIQGDLHATFDTPSGKNTLQFIKLIGSWVPTVMDSNETNDVIARDANRRLIGTILTMLELGPEQIVQLARKGNE